MAQLPVALRNVSSRFRAIGSVTRRLPAFARGAAWFFIGFSLLNLLWVITVKWGSPGGLTTLWQTTVGDETRRAFALAYDGWPGMLLAIIQFAAVSAAAVATILPHDRARRIGHIALCAWSALWFIDLLGLAMFDGTLVSAFQASGFGVLFGATLYRALVGMPRRGRTVEVAVVVAPGRGLGSGAGARAESGLASVDTRRFGRAKDLARRGAATVRRLTAVAHHKATGRMREWRERPKAAG